jgi:hypothetical protein
MQKLNGLSADEASFVYFSRVAVKQNEIPLVEVLAQVLADLASTPLPTVRTPGLQKIAIVHDLNRAEAALVLLVRRLAEQPEKLALAKTALADTEEELIQRLKARADSGQAAPGQPGKPVFAPAP